MAVMEKRVSLLEETMQKLAYEHLNTEVSIQNLSREMKEFKDEMLGFKLEMQEFKDEMQADRKEMNKKWGALANKMGTIVEDIVAPNIPTLAEKYFNVKTFDDFAVIYSKRHPKDKERMKEFDIIAVSDKYLFLNETKSTVRQKDLEDFVQTYKEIFEYFPNFKDKKLIPIFASLRMEKGAVQYLTKHGIYAMAMKGETMDLLNFEAVLRRST